MTPGQPAGQPVTWQTPDEVSDPHHMRGMDWLEIGCSVLYGRVFFN